MKLDQLKKNQGWRVTLAPPAIHVDSIGRELPPRNEDWIIVQVTDEAVRIDEDSMLSLTTKLGTDAVASFTSDPSRSTPGGIQYGLLLLKMYSHAIALACTSMFRDPTSGKLTRIDQLSTNTATTLTAGGRRLCRNSAPFMPPVT
jgi:hypothetical protein